MLSLDRLVGKESANHMRSIGLHKIAAARLQKEGYDVPDELNLRAAIQALGTNIYIKNAAYKNVLDGVVCLKELMQGQ